jgi:hypothetical protein
MRLDRVEFMLKQRRRSDCKRNLEFQSCVRHVDVAAPSCKTAVNKGQ